MIATEYQLAAARTDWPDWPDRWADGVIHAALGLASEAGEIAGHVQKWQGQGHDLDRAAIIEELGDTLWFAAKLARVLGADLGDVMAANLAKLAGRYPNGFDPALSRDRLHVAHLLPAGPEQAGLGL